MFKYWPQVSKRHTPCNETMRIKWTKHKPGQQNWESVYAFLLRRRMAALSNRLIGMQSWTMPTGAYDLFVGKEDECVKVGLKH